MNKQKPVTNETCVIKRRQQKEKEETIHVFFNVPEKQHTTTLNSKFCP